jgi:uncharacterized repeat protein (TIGR03803 family)
MVSRTLRTALAVMTAVLLLTSVFTPHAWAASKFKVLYSFKGYHARDGGFSQAGLTFDAAGNLYGTTLRGGRVGANDGTVFQLSPAGNGSWTEKVLHMFNCGTGTGGCQPVGNLIMDSAGSLYGTASTAGRYGGGTVFRLTPGSGGTWTETVLHSFGNGNDGRSPRANLIFDASGNLYGTTFGGGGSGGNGTVFELSPNGDGTWSENVLYSFHSGGTDGSSPQAGVIFDPAGNLYGTTRDGGTDTFHVGTVFELSPNGDGTWTESILHSFQSNGKDGNTPVAGLALDSAGNLYGTTSLGGRASCGCGTVFELTPGQNGQWTEKVLHSFNGKDGSAPYGGVILDSAGNLYGTTSSGGSSNYGEVFKLSPNGHGGWKESVLHSFSINSKHGNKDGVVPWAGLILDAAGNLYGTATAGGSKNNGTVFEITP